MNDKLLELHDGELNEGEATRLRTALTDQAADRAALDAMDRVDRTLMEVDRLIGASAGRIESGKEALKAVLRSRASDQQTRGAHFAFRRRTIAVVSGALAAAAAIMIWVAWPAPGVIGTVRYPRNVDVGAGGNAERIRLGSVVRAPSKGMADIQVPNVFHMWLDGGGEVAIGSRASDLRLTVGWVTLQTFAEVMLRIGDGPHSVLGNPDSGFRLRLVGDGFELSQQTGTSVVITGEQRQRVEAGQTVRIGLDTSRLTDPEGQQQ